APFDIYHTNSLITKMELLEGSGNAQSWRSAPRKLSRNSQTTRPRPRSKNPAKYKDHGQAKLLKARFFKAFLCQGVARGHSRLIQVKTRDPPLPGDCQTPTKKGAEAPFFVTACYAGKAGGLTFAMSSRIRTT